jgi:Fe-S cluster assembly protein SufD
MSFPVPTGREEEWRFTPLRRLRGLEKDVPMDLGKIVTVADPAVVVMLPQHDAHGIDTAFLPKDRVSARAFASLGSATRVTVPEGVVASRPTFLSIRGESIDPAAAHTIVEVGANASAVVVLEYSGSSTLADNVEFNVGEGGSLRVVSLQDWDDDAVHLSHHVATVGKDATFAHTAVTLGGSVVRLAPSVRFSGPGGNAELRGVYFADAGQHLEHRLFVDHNQPDCRSRVTYKGALQGDGAHGVWIGDVLIRVEATGTDSYESNRNLVLSDGTRVDSVPNLEILTGEVIRAGHASTSGRLDDESLFYLMARGISEVEARRLVIRGFFGELVAQIDVPELADRVMTAIEVELEKGT